MIPAGNMPSRELGKDQCSRIMTGAPVPGGADCVIMQEHVREEEKGQIFFTAGATDVNIHPRGKDLRKGDLILPAGTILTPGHLGIIASTGNLLVSVSQSLKVGILATGSELVEPDQVPEGAQIRNSNSHQLAAQVEETGHIAVILGIVEDKREALANRITVALQQLDLLILTGGASVGALDLVPGVLEELGFKREYERVAIQPGKPVSFAYRGDKVCFGLSGNPVSSFVQFELLVRPYLETCSGAISVNRRISIQVDREYHRERAGRQFFLPVIITGDGTCSPVEYHGSGHLHALANASGLAEIPAGKTGINKGEQVYVRLL
jgi:molybdopterin molybdotransferase